jgi:hypothetical protein
MNPLVPSCRKNTGKPALVALFVLLQEDKSEKYCARQISTAEKMTKSTYEMMR